MSVCMCACYVCVWVCSNVCLGDIEVSCQTINVGQLCIGLAIILDYRAFIFSWFSKHVDLRPAVCIATRYIVSLCVLNLKHLHCEPVFNKRVYLFPGLLRKCFKFSAFRGTCIIM